MRYQFQPDQTAQTSQWNHDSFIKYQMAITLVLIVAALRYFILNPANPKIQEKNPSKAQTQKKKTKTQNNQKKIKKMNNSKFSFTIDQNQNDSDIINYRKNNTSNSFQQCKVGKVLDRLNRFVPDTLIYRDQTQLRQIYQKKQRETQRIKNLELRKIQSQNRKIKEAEDKKKKEIQEQRKKIQEAKRQEQRKKEQLLLKNKVQTIQKSNSLKEDQKPINKLTQTIKTEKNQNIQKVQNIKKSEQETIPKPFPNSFGLFTAVNNKVQNKAQTKGLFQNKPIIDIKNSPLMFQRNGILDKNQVKNDQAPRDLSKNNLQNPLLKLKNQRPKNLSLQSNQSSSLSGNLNISGSQYLQKIMEFSDKAKESCQITTRMNNFGGPKSSIKQLWQKTTSFISTINVSKPNEVQTFAFKLWNLIVNTLIRNSSSKQGIERMPAKPKTNTCQKNALNSYILSINIYRMLGHQAIWLIIFGKTLRLLQFIYKRNRIIQGFQDLDLIKNKHVNKQGQELAIKYLLRVDFLTYFLFGLTTFDPLLFANYISSTSRQDKNTVDQIRKSKNKWSYKEFWFLYEVIMKNQQKTYFKPIVYMNILSSIYLQVYDNKSKTMNNKQFDHIYKYVMKEGLRYTNSKQFKKYDEVKKIAEEEIQVKGYSFFGDDFTDEIVKLESRFKEKDIQYKLDRGGFQDKASIFYYFKGNL